MSILEEQCEIEQRKNEQVTDACCVPYAEKPKEIKKKRDIFRFKAEKDVSINLEHVTNVNLEGKRITFEFYSTATYVEIESEERAQEIYEQIINLWVSDVLEK